MNDLFLRKEKNYAGLHIFQREDREPKVKGEIWMSNFYIEEGVLLKVA